MRLQMILLLGAALAAALSAQTRDTGAVFGTVTASQGAAIPGAVTALNNEVLSWSNIQSC